ncbi:MAG: pyruvate kinase [Bdellovibrionales bacterium]|nr:pyruvate kinase [Bdellovibrionales bacterium]
MKPKKTKIIATLGPASDSPRVMKELIEAGVDVFRLNFSHGTLEEKKAIIKEIRSLAKKSKTPVGVLADLPGPKLRVGDFENGEPIFLRTGHKIRLTTNSLKGNTSVIPVSFSKLPQIVKKNDRILLADGNLELSVLSVDDKDVSCNIVVGGELKEHQGLNIPNHHIDVPALTFRDKEAIKLLGSTQVDYVALSFVQKPEDIEKARFEMKKARIDLPIYAKIEKPEALKHIEDILTISDGMMIARGDLGVELPTADIPIVQKQLIRLAAKMAIPVITATQMLESMIYNPRPTRAETTDIANAIWDGSDAVMLSGETATGAHPVRAVTIMAEIIRKAEAYPEFQWNPMETIMLNTSDHLVLHAAATIARPSEHKAIITYTETGNTAILLSKFRPHVPIYALTPKKETFNKMSLIWGVRPFISLRGKNADEMIAKGDQILTQQTDLKKGDKVIVAAGTKLTTGATNMMKIHCIGEGLSK